MRRWKTIAAVTTVALIAVPLGNQRASAASTVLGTFDIGPGNLYDAGHPTPVIGGPLPLKITLPTGSAGQAITLSNVSGGVTQGVNAAGGPDGGYDPSLAMDIDPLDGISGIKADPGLGGFLGGVFTSDAEPADPAPTALDYTAATKTLTPNDPSYTPGLDQVFFMGDGLTGTSVGQTQQFVVPAGATTLWLGVVDAGYYQGAPISTEGNTGGFNATIGLQPFRQASPLAAITVTEKTQGSPSAITSMTELQASVVGDACTNGDEPDPAVRSLATGQLLAYPYVLFDNFSTPTTDAAGKQHYTFEFRSGLPGDMSIELDCGGQSIGSAPYTVKGNRYVGLGDSYSAGEGDAESTFLPGTTFPAKDKTHSTTGCHRSIKGWEPAVAAYERLNGDNWTFAACSGGVVDDLYDMNVSYTRFGETELPQLLAVTSATKLVTMTMGGNDVGFQAILSDCLFDTALQAPGRPDCRAAKRAAYKTATAGIASLTAGIPVSGLAQGSKSLSAVYVDIAERMAPGGTLVVAGYPRLFGTNQFSYGTNQLCTVGAPFHLDSLSITYADAKWIDSVTDQGDQIISDQIDRANAQLKLNHSTQTVVMAKTVDSKFHGHRLCDSGTSHINGAIFALTGSYPEQISFHPNANGQADYAAAVEAALPRQRLG